MHRSSVAIATALGLFVGGVAALAVAQPAAAQPAERFTLFEMFGRVN